MIDFSKVYLGSSNLGKLQEYASFGLNLAQKPIADLPEVQGTDEEVIVYKALAMGQGVLVEDTSLIVEGEDVGVNIKWLTKELHNNPKYEGRKAIWRVFLGLVYGDFLYVVSADIDGKISSKLKNKQAFGFDSIFIPNGSNETLDQLSKQGRKSEFSARKNAVLKLLNQEFNKKIPTKTIPAWTGDYQK